MLSSTEHWKTLVNIVNGLTGVAVVRDRQWQLYVGAGEAVPPIENLAAGCPPPINVMLCLNHANNVIAF